MRIVGVVFFAVNGFLSMLLGVIFTVFFANLTGPAMLGGTVNQTITNPVLVNNALGIYSVIRVVFGTWFGCSILGLIISYFLDSQRFEPEEEWEPQ